jgi:hypothetical protein
LAVEERSSKRKEGDRPEKMALQDSKGQDTSRGLQGATNKLRASPGGVWLEGESRDWIWMSKGPIEVQECCF